MHVRNSIAAVLTVVILVLCPCIPVQAETENTSADFTSYGDFLVDRGNGDIDWYELVKGTTFQNTVENSLTAAGIPYITGTEWTVDGVGPVTIGSASTGGSLTVSGTTGITVECGWKVYGWSTGDTEWNQVTDLSQHFDTDFLAIGYYQDGGVPAVTPDYRSAWTMLGIDSENSMNQTVLDSDVRTETAHTVFPKDQDKAWGDYSGVLYSRGHVFVKFGNKSMSTGSGAVACYDPMSGNQIWQFNFKINQMEIATPAIFGNSMYVQTTDGFIYKLDCDTGELQASTSEIPDVTPGMEYEGVAPFGEGPTSIVFNSGSLYCQSSNGMVYCFDTDLNLIWSYQTAGKCYYAPATVTHGNVFCGAYDGRLYVLDQCTGEFIDSLRLHIQYDEKGHGHGLAGTPQVFDNGDNLTLILNYGDGLGMNSTIGSLAFLNFDRTTGKLTKISDLSDMDMSVSRMLTRYVTDDFEGVIFSSSKGIMKADTTGAVTVINNFIGKTYEVHSTPTLVNNKMLYISTYEKSLMFQTDLQGNIISALDFPENNFSMANAIVVDGFIFRCDDNGFYMLQGAVLDEYTIPVAPYVKPLWLTIVQILGMVVAVLIAFWAVLRFGMKWQHPFSDLKKHTLIYFYGEEYTHNTRSKRKLRLILIMGLLLTFGAFIASLCIGSKTTLGVGEALSCMISSIQKGGSSLTYEEMLIYNERLPRAIAAFAVGIGLSIAGALYQAVIKNPLVEPYIMGVSSGAGTMAIAVIVFDFTLFGLLSPDNIYLTAISAILGGLLAFGCTMLLAEKTGGKSINYVLAGIVIGLVFSAVQSLMIIKAGNEIGSALSWLYGSFTSMTWEKVWLVLVPVLAMSSVPLIWAKELNLVLLGEDQAMQMGLNAKRFDRCMLIIASVITAFCVAFCGIIGFVGLVIPHLSRMIVGGDHRLMLPTSMAFGGFLMISADLLARILLPGFELPVGAVTTAIGVPVFVYLLLKRGKSYDI